MVNRVRRVESGLGLTNHGPMPIVWNGKMDDEWQRRAEIAKKRGCGIHLITFAHTTCADSKEEADALIEERIEQGMGFAAIVVRHRDDPDKTLAVHEPVLPDWLKNFEDSEEGSTK